MRFKIDLELLACLDDLFLSHRAHGVSDHSRRDTLQIYVGFCEMSVRFCPIFTGMGVDGPMLL